MIELIESRNLGPPPSVRPGGEREREKEKERKKENKQNSWRNRTLIHSTKVSYLHTNKQQEYPERAVEERTLQPRLTVLGQPLRQPPQVIEAIDVPLKQHPDEGQQTGMPHFIKTSIEGVYGAPPFVNLMRKRF